MIELKRTTTVGLSPDAVVAYLADFTNAEEWDAGTKSCTRLDDGPVKVGSTWRNVSEFRGKETELRYTLTRLEPRRLTFTGENKTVSSTDDMTFTSDGTGTRVHYLARFRFKGLAALAGPFVKGALDKLGDDTIEQMRSVLELRSRT